MTANSLSTLSLSGLLPVICDMYPSPPPSHMSCTHLIWLGHLSTAYVTRRGQSCVASISEGYVIPTPTILSQSITVKIQLCVCLCEHCVGGDCVVGIWHTAGYIWLAIKQSRLCEQCTGQEFKARSLSSPYHIMWLLYFVKGIDGLDVFNRNTRD